MIGFYGSFKQDNTYNVILEYADKGNLEQYFRTVSPPTREEDKIKFWERLFNLAKALVQMHGMQPSKNDGPRIFPGWHQDIKPENILVTSVEDGSDYDCYFKLADMGLSHFRSEVACDEIEDIDSHGTRSYGAPECYRPDDFLESCPLKVKQKVDIWSLGCIYSEAVIWIMTGHDGLFHYRMLRRDAVASIPNFRDGNCFHDGHVVLDIVNSKHATLRSLIDSNCITNRVIDPMISFMLATSDTRPDALQLWKWSQQILKDAMNQLQSKGTVRSSPYNPRPQLYDVSSLAHWRGGQVSTSEGQTPLGPRVYGPPGVYLSTALEVPARGPPTTVNTGLGMLDGVANPMWSAQRGAEFSFPRRSSSNRSTQGQGPGLTGYSVKLPGEELLDQASFNGNHRLQTPFISPDSRQKKRTTLDSVPKQNCSLYAIPPAASLGGHQKNGLSTSSQQQYYATQYRHPSAHGNIPPNNRFQPTISTSFTSTCPYPPSSCDKKLPELTIDEAHRWLTQKKQGNKNDQLPASYLLDRLNQRDHMFLIDNSASMEQHWTQVQALFKILSYLVKRKDPDGLELKFTVSSGNTYKSKKTSDLSQTLAGMAPHGISNITSDLNGILYTYAERLAMPRGIRRKKVRPLSVYIFTDGVWQPECEAIPPIKYIVEKLQQNGSPGDQAGLQFIRFGDDPMGLSRLEHLDSNLGLPRDIVDTEPYERGNVWKMLLGAIDRRFDRQHERQQANTRSSNTRTPETFGALGYK